MIPADDDGRLQFARRDHLVECEAEAMPVAQTHPADARRQALELDPRTRHVEPIVQRWAVRHERLDLGVGPEDILRIARERGPTERPDATAEQRANISWHEAWEIEGVLDAFLERHLPNVVAVVDGRHAGVGI